MLHLNDRLDFSNNSLMPLLSVQLFAEYLPVEWYYPMRPLIMSGKVKWNSNRRFSCYSKLAIGIIRL